MSTEELLWRSYSTLFAFSGFHRQVNPAGHTVWLCWGPCGGGPQEGSLVIQPKASS